MPALAKIEIAATLVLMVGAGLMDDGLAGRRPTLKPTARGAIATHLQERFVANCSELKNRPCEPLARKDAEIATQRSIVIPRAEGGGSSTLPLIGSITAASGILGHPLSRATTTEYVSASAAAHRHAST
jgi:hypothetical protein